MHVLCQKPSVACKSVLTISHDDVRLGGGIEFFFGFPSTGPYFFIDLSGGLYLGADVGPSVFAGLVFTGTPEDIPGVGFEVQVTIPTPIVG